MSLGPTALASLVMALVIGLFAGPIGRYFGLLDFPDGVGGRKLHTRVTPLVGGMAVAAASVGAIAATLVFADLAPPVCHALVWLGIAVAAMFAIGAADDRKSLSPLIRLALSTLVLAVVIFAVPEFSLAVVRFTGIGAVPLGMFAGLFSLLCLVGLQNSVNMADGKNGIVISLALIWSAILWWRVPPAMLPILAAAAAALVVMLWFNMRNRLFLGDGGGYAISSLFGLLAICSYNAGPAPTHADDVVLMFAVPVLDTLRLIVSRAMQRRSPFAGGRDHLHHFLFASVGWPRGLWIYVLLVALPNAGAVMLPGTAPVWIAITALAYTLILRGAGVKAAAAGEPRSSTIVALRRIPSDIRPVVRAPVRDVRQPARRRSSRARL